MNATREQKSGGSIKRNLVVWSTIGLIGGVAVGVLRGQYSAKLGHDGLRRVGQPASWEELIELPSAQVSRTDVGAANLLCAVGLPGAEGLDIADCRRTLDEWVEHVRSETQRNWHRFRANPAEFENSEGYFRMLVMAVVLYEDFHIRYNPNRMVSPATATPDDKFFADSRDVFLHGLISPPHLGTCSSLPVLYAAVGRRLGYPLKLVTTKAHLFLRWEDDKERFNMEATGKGMNRYDDAHFKQWPFPVTEAEIVREHYLKSLSPAEELAVFLSLRGNCLREAGKQGEAAHCYEAASRLAPDWPAYSALLASVKNRNAQTKPMASSY